MVMKYILQTIFMLVMFVLDQSQLAVFHDLCDVIGKEMPGTNFQEQNVNISCSESCRTTDGEL